MKAHRTCVNTENTLKDLSCNFLYNIVQAADFSRQSNTSFSRLGYKEGKHSENKYEINKHSHSITGKNFLKTLKPKDVHVPVHAKLYSLNAVNEACL